ncbi:hypothetical protein TNCV_586111 [Trichonephila clavipes]|nr:hypothetical protein TNCV_586111 [Trichonephila clavipes]
MASSTKKRRKVQDSKCSREFQTWWAEKYGMINKVDKAVCVLCSGTVFLRQRNAIKSCVKLDQNEKETFEKLWKAYGDGAKKQSQTFMKHKRFREDGESVNDDERSGFSSTLQTDDLVQNVRLVL